MPEITKSGAKLHLFIVTHKYTDLYFIFSFNNQPQVGKPTWGYDYTTVLRRLSHPIIRHHPSDCASTSSAITHRIAPTAQYITMRKTAEERFNMLARGWLAYPVTSMHAHLPPKSGCINVIPWFALSRRRATALFRNPVCKAQRSVPGFSSTPNSACRRYATSPPPIGLCIPIVRHHHLIAHPHRPPSIYMRFGDALLRRPRKRSRLQLTPDRVGGTRTDAYASRSAAAERSIAKCRKLGRR